MTVIPPEDNVLGDPALLKKIVLDFRAINHPLRQRILRFLHKEGRANVKAIYKNVGLQQAVCSQHLAILRRARLVLTVREKRRVFYSVYYQKLERLHELAETILPTNVSRPESKNAFMKK
jgi:DNA-binding transcriptional ArsR family regulator